MAYKSYEELLQGIQADGQNWSAYDLDLAKNSLDFGNGIFAQKQNYANAQDDSQRRAANAAAEALRSRYGSYYGGSDGSLYNPFGKRQEDLSGGDGPAKKQSYAPSYTEYASKYQDQIDSILSGLLGRKEFSYHPASDPSYQAYAEQYRNLGRQARQSALGDVAAMNGGQVNSYAVTAAQQAQDAYNAELTGAIPALKELAYEMYLGDLNQKRSDLSALMGLDEVDYGRHMDRYTADFNQWQANYGVDRDALADQRYDDETEYNRLKDRAELLAAAGDYSGYAALGYSADQISALEQAALAAASRGGGGGGGGRGGGDEEVEEPVVEKMHFNEYKDFYYAIKGSISKGNYAYAEALFNKNANRLTDSQYKNLMKLLK